MEVQPEGNAMAAKHLFRYLALLLVLGLAAAACGSDDPASSAAGETTMAEGMEMDDADGHSEEYEFGDPMEAADASRTIEVTANDDFTFDPASVTITTGETVTFRVTNAGVIPHDFTLGDTHMQDEHEAEMAEMSGDMAMHDEPNAFVLEPGETKEVTWHMTQAGEILFGCHQPGHYAAGMKGTITIEG